VLPFHDSVFAIEVVVYPPINKDTGAVVPTPAPSYLAVFTSVISVQEEPLYCSTLDIGEGTGSPLIAKPDVNVPLPAAPTALAVFKLPPVAHVAAGIPAAFPKPFNVVPPDKNIEPSASC